MNFRALFLNTGTHSEVSLAFSTLRDCLAASLAIGPLQLLKCFVETGPSPLILLTFVACLIPLLHMYVSLSLSLSFFFRVRSVRSLNLRYFLFPG